MTSISITRIPLITASVQTDKQKATVSLKVLGAAEVCLQPYLYSTLFYWCSGLMFSILDAESLVLGLCTKNRLF